MRVLPGAGEGGVALVEDAADREAAAGQAARLQLRAGGLGVADAVVM